MPTCLGEGDELPRDDILEALVSVGQRLPQDGLQAAEEGHGVQAVEGEAAGERQQTVGRVDRTGRCVRHHVSVHGAVQGRCRGITATASVRQCNILSFIQGMEDSQSSLHKNTSKFKQKSLGTSPSQFDQ